MSTADVVPCPQCGYVEPEYIGPGLAIRVHGTVHLADCPLVTLPRSPEADAEFRRGLAAIDEAERRAWIDSQNVWIR